ncbi:hypothetical protein D3C85_1420070 [compost metagenome]
MAGGADHGVRPHDAARLGDRRIVLTDMDAVAAGGFRQIGPVVQDHRHAVRLGDRRQPGHGGLDLLVRGVLEPDLQSRDRTRRQGLLQQAREGLQIGDGRRRDQIQLTGGTGRKRSLTSHAPALPVPAPGVNVATPCERFALALINAIASHSQ